MTRVLSRPHAEPDFTQLTAAGWSIISCAGPYVTVWKDGEELVLLWRDGAWLRLDHGSTTEFCVESATVSGPEHPVS